MVFRWHIKDGKHMHVTKSLMNNKRERKNFPTLPSQGGLFCVAVEIRSTSQGPTTVSIHAPLM